MPDRRFKPKKQKSAVRQHIIFLTLLALLLVGSVAAFWPPATKIKQGLDVSGGLSVVLQASKTDGSDISAEDMSDSRSIVEQRVNALGASEASVQVQGSSQLLVQIPGVEDETEAIKTIGQTGVLEFVSINDISDENEESAIKNNQTSNNRLKGVAGLSTYQNDKFTANLSDVNSKTVLDMLSNAAKYSAALATSAAAANTLDPSLIVADKLEFKESSYTPLFTGADIVNVTVGQESETSAFYAVNLELNGTASDAFATATKALATNNDPIVILLDRKVESAPTVSNEITGGRVAITGSYTLDAANSFRTVLQSGSLPVSLSPSNTQIVGPTLGQESLAAAIIIALLGLAIVALYLLYFYRGLGLLTAAAVFVFALLYLGIIALLSMMGLFALSLAGIAGIVLSIGMAADSSILVLERFKEEVRMGRSIRAASITGTWHAIKTSLDADFVTLVSALALFFIAVGSVKGFGLTLALGVVCDVITMFLFKAPLIRLLAPKIMSLHPKFWNLAGDLAYASAAGEVVRHDDFADATDETASASSAPAESKAGSKTGGKSTAKTTNTSEFDATASSDDAEIIDIAGISKADLKKFANQRKNKK